MDLPAQLRRRQVVADEDGAHDAAQLFDGLVGRVLEAAAREAAQHLLGLGGAQAQGGRVRRAQLAVGVEAVAEGAQPARSPLPEPGLHDPNLELRCELHHGGLHPENHASDSAERPEPSAIRAPVPLVLLSENDAYSAVNHELKKEEAAAG